MTQLAHIDLEQDTLVSTVSELVDAASGVVILSRSDLSEATDLVKVIKGRHREIEEERTRLVKPFNDGVKQINARFKSILQPLETAESDIKAKMLAFQQEEARAAEVARREAERLAAEEAARVAAEFAAENLDRPDLPPPPPMPVAVTPEAPKSTYGAFGGVSTVKKVWAFEVLDIAALAAARPDLVTVDSAKVNAEIRGKGGDIPGLRVFEKETIAVR